MRSRSGRGNKLQRRATVELRPSAPADGDKLDKIKFRMGESPDMLRKIEPLKHGPARWIQTIAANFFTRKFFPLKDDCLQPGVSAKRRAARSSGTATDDCNVKCFH